MKINEADIFLSVFSDITFPYLAADLELLGKTLKKSERKSFIRFPLPINPLKRSIVVASLRGLLRNLDVPFPTANFLAQSNSIVQSGTKKALLEMAKTPGLFGIYETENHLIWEEEGLWPVAYSTLFKQIIGLIEIFTAATDKQRKSINPSLTNTLLSEYPRQMPTQVHYAFASLGAWLAGGTNFQYFSLFATQQQLSDSNTNRSYAQKIGYNNADSDALDKSGIVALPASLVLPLLIAQGIDMPIFGSIPIDEVNAVNLPNTLDINEKTKNKLPGFILDKYYRSPFTARVLESTGLLGANTVLRDHYADFYAGVDQVALIRCKHYSAPVIEVTSLNELRSLVDKIPSIDKNGVFFRGQTSFYELEREDRVKSLLFADSCNLEPSLLTSASRHGFDYDTLHFALRHYLQERVYSNNTLSNKTARHEWRKQLSSPTCKIDYALMALAQHYGFPSHGLDVTLSLDVATWFATHKFTYNDRGKSEYKNIVPKDWSSEPLHWPVVFACQMVTRSTNQSLHDCHELADFGFRAKRPIAQQAKFFLGGHSDHQNRLAECVICAFRLRPNVYNTTSTFERLFPKPDDDPAYRVILDFAAEPAFHAFEKYVNKFH
ncbi:MAG: FRG domain-containing protein [Desulfobacter sp.]|nr:MAG: FRG domain-containing protein [Desulfobacter sp.]